MKKCIAAILTCALVLLVAWNYSGIRWKQPEYGGMRLPYDRAYVDYFMLTKEHFPGLARMEKLPTWDIRGSYGWNWPWEKRDVTCAVQATKGDSAWDIKSTMIYGSYFWDSYTRERAEKSCEAAFLMNPPISYPKPKPPLPPVHEIRRKKGVAI